MTTVIDQTTAVDQSRKARLSRFWSLPRMTANYIFGAAMRIFSPSTDNYPETGTQPYHGDPSSRKQQNSRWENN